MLINEQLAQLDMTKYRLSKESGVPQATINDICSGKTDIDKCTAGTLYKIAKVLNTTIEAILESVKEQTGNKDIDFPAWNSRVSYMLEGAKQSRYRSDQWFRYLRKCVDGDTILLTPEEIDYLIKSRDLSMYQIITLKRAMQPGTITNKKVTKLNQKTTTPMVKEILRRRQHA